MGKMAADWTPDEIPEPTPIPEIVPHNYTPDHEPASLDDIESNRSYTPEEAEPAHPVVEFPTGWIDRHDPENRISAPTLQRETKTRGGGGSSKGRSHTEPVKLTAQERMDRHVAAIKNIDPQNYISETEEQRMLRLAQAALKKAERDQERQSRVGRPRDGEEARKVISASVDAETSRVLKEFNLHPGRMLDIIANALKDSEARAVLTGDIHDDTMAA
jgi:hypothetical protein